VGHFSSGFMASNPASVYPFLKGPTEGLLANRS
jgi:hypothetical protein